MHVLVRPPRERCGRMAAPILEHLCFTQLLNTFASCNARTFPAAIVARCTGMPVRRALETRVLSWWELSNTAIGCRTRKGSCRSQLLASTGLAEHVPPPSTDGIDAHPLVVERSGLGCPRSRAPPLGILSAVLLHVCVSTPHRSPPWRRCHVCRINPKPSTLNPFAPSLP